MKSLFAPLLNHWLTFYRKSSIQLILSLTFTAVSVAGMVFLGITLFLRFSASTNTQLAESSQLVLSQVNLNLDAYLRRMMRLSDTMYYSVVKQADLDTDSISQEMNLLYENNRDSVVSIALFTKYGELVEATPISSLKSTVIPQFQSWFSAAEARMENLHFSTPHVQNLFDDSDYKYSWVVSLSRHVELTNAGTTQGGVLLVDMSYSGIEQICMDVKLPSSGYLYLMDQNGEIIYHPRQQLIYADLLEENNQLATTYEDGSRQELFQGQSRMITVKTVGYTGWKLVAVVPSDYFANNYGQLLLFFLFVILFSVFLMVFANLHLSERISNPIKDLDRAVRTLELGQKELEISVRGPYEIEHLSHSISTMVSTLHHLMEDIIQQEAQKRKSELDILHSQINPHFLYNTLDSVVWMTENGRTEEAVLMVTSLARLFRIALSKGHTIIPLQDELEHARHYLTIQKMRFKNKFTATIQMDEEVKDLYAIKLMVQPILENAIYHGMTYADGDGEILIHAFRQGDCLCIDVEDNGPGMREETVERLLDVGYTGPNSKGSGIGVRNVHQRIGLTFGTDYGLTIFSEPDAGTRVRITLPLVNQKAMEALREEEEHER